MPVMRQSKVKHVYAQVNKREDCFDGIRVTKNSWDSTFCSVSAKFLAVITESAGGGAFLVVPVDKPGRIEVQSMPLVTGHKAPVLDIQWSPHDDHVIASGSEDCTVKIWRIPDNGLVAQQPLTEAQHTLIAHQRRVGLVVWHPTVQNILFSSGADNQSFLWDVESEEILLEISFPDMITSASFNSNGALLVTSCKDKLTRLLDARSGQVLHQIQCHEGTKPQQCLFLHTNEFVTTGFSRMSERQIAVWDTSNLTKPKAVFELDTTNGTLFPFFDRDLNLLYLCGKGDSVIRFFEIVADAECIYPIGQFKSTAAQRGFGWLPKRAVNTSVCEVGRLFRLLQTGFCEVIPFIVPRKSELFQDDLYPDAVSDQPALDLESWLSGTDREPLTASMRPDTQIAPKPLRTARTANSALVSKVKPAEISGATSTSSSSLNTPGKTSKKSEDSNLKPSTGLTTSVGSNSKDDTSSLRKPSSTTSPSKPTFSETKSGSKESEAAMRSGNENQGGSSSSASTAPQIDVQQFQAFLKDLEHMKVILRGHEKRILLLESKFPSD